MVQVQLDRAKALKSRSLRKKGIRRSGKRRVLVGKGAGIKIRKISSRDARYVIEGKIDVTDAHSKSELLEKISERIFPSRNQALDNPRAGDGKGNIMIKAVSYKREDLGSLPQSALDYLEKMKKKVAADQIDNVKASGSSKGRYVAVESKYGRLVDLTKS